jgi:hypothetical protein
MHVGHTGIRLADYNYSEDHEANSALVEQGDYPMQIVQRQSPNHKGIFLVIAGTNIGGPICWFDQQIEGNDFVFCFDNFPFNLVE